MTEREEFEAAIAPLGLTDIWLETDDQGKYTFARTMDAWLGWQAARTSKPAPEVRAAEPVTDLRMCANGFSQHPGPCKKWCGDDRTCPSAPDNIRKLVSGGKLMPSVVPVTYPPTAPSVPNIDQKMRDAGYTARPMPSRDPDHLASAPTQASATSVQKPNEIEAAAKAVIELWGVTPRWNDRIKQANALYRLAYAIEPDKWKPKLANGLTEAKTSATRSVSGLTQPQAESEGGEP